jgi:hypothetical protein
VSLGVTRLGVCATMSWMELADLSDVAAQLDGVLERRRAGLLEWRYHGRLVARQLDERRVVIRSSFDVRDMFLQSFPETFRGSWWIGFGVAACSDVP